MRLIDADAMKEWLDEYLSVFKKYDKSEVKGFVDHAPTIEPKRGEWIDYSCGSGCYCSNCGWDGDDTIDERIIQDFIFCPNCGARMKGADDE